MNAYFKRCCFFEFPIVGRIQTYSSCACGLLFYLWFVEIKVSYPFYCTFWIPRVRFFVWFSVLVTVSIFSMGAVLPWVPCFPVEFLEQLVFLHAWQKFVAQGGCCFSTISYQSRRTFDWLSKKCVYDFQSIFIPNARYPRITSRNTGNPNKNCDNDVHFLHFCMCTVFAARFAYHRKYSALTLLVELLICSAPTWNVTCSCATNLRRSAPHVSSASDRSTTSTNTSDPCTTTTKIFVCTFEHPA